jgi:hypothetical protein
MKEYNLASIFDEIIADSENYFLDYLHDWINYEGSTQDFAQDKDLDIETAMEDLILALRLAGKDDYQ